MKKYKLRPREISPRKELIKINTHDGLKETRESTANKKTENIEKVDCDIIDIQISDLNIEENLTNSQKQKSNLDINKTKGNSQNDSFTKDKMNYTKEKVPKNNIEHENQSYNCPNKTNLTNKKQQYQSVNNKKNLKVQNKINISFKDISTQDYQNKQSKTKNNKLNERKSNLTRTSQRFYTSNNNKDKSSNDLVKVNIINCDGTPGNFGHNTFINQNNVINLNNNPYNSRTYHPQSKISDNKKCLDSKTTKVEVKKRNTYINNNNNNNNKNNKNNNKLMTSLNLKTNDFSKEKDYNKTKNVKLFNKSNTLNSPNNNCNISGKNLINNYKNLLSNKNKNKMNIQYSSNAMNSANSSNNVISINNNPNLLVSLNKISKEDDDKLLRGSQNNSRKNVMYSNLKENNDGFENFRTCVPKRSVSNGENSKLKFSFRHRNLNDERSKSKRKDENRVDSRVNEITAKLDNIIKEYKIAKNLIEVKK